jgi:hypothetical protein
MQHLMRKMIFQSSKGDGNGSIVSQEIENASDVKSAIMARSVESEIHRRQFITLVKTLRFFNCGRIRV